LESFLRDATSIKPRAVIWFPREHYMQGTLKYPAEINLLPILHTAPLTLDGWYGLLSHAGYQPGFRCDSAPSVPSDQAIVVPFTEFLTDEEWIALERFSDDGGRVILQLPTENAEAARRVSARLGLEMQELERRKCAADGWMLTSPQGKNVGTAHIKRVTVADVDTPEVFARFYDTKRPALLAQRSGRWLIGAFDIGSSYDHTLRTELRGSIEKWLKQGDVAPVMIVEGIDEDYRPMVEVSALEQDGRALLIVCNRSPYEWDLKITVSKYRPIAMHVPPFESRQQFANA
jgi:hypothetical protein